MRLKESVEDVAIPGAGTFKLFDKSDNTLEYFSKEHLVSVEISPVWGNVEVRFGNPGHGSILMSTMANGAVTSQRIAAILKGIDRVFVKEFPAIIAKIKARDMFSMMYGYQTSKRAWFEDKFSDALRNAIAQKISLLPLTEDTLPLTVSLGVIGFPAYTLPMSLIGSRSLQDDPYVEVIGLSNPEKLYQILKEQESLNEQRITVPPVKRFPDAILASGDEMAIRTINSGWNSRTLMFVWISNGTLSQTMASIHYGFDRDGTGRVVLSGPTKDCQYGTVAFDASTLEKTYDKIVKYIFSKYDFDLDDMAATGKAVTDSFRAAARTFGLERVSPSDLRNMFQLQ